MYRVIESRLKDKIFLNIFRLDNKQMSYSEIQKVKNFALGDVECIMLFPKKTR